MIKGWRANTSYFYIAKFFVRDEVDVDILEELLALGGLGIQYCIKTEQAYKKLSEHSDALQSIDFTEFNKKYNRRDTAGGRTPVILSRYVNHSRTLYEKLKDSADEVFLLSAENSRKEHNAVLQKMKQVKADKSMILVATGKLIGEGVDFIQRICIKRTYRL